MNVNITLLMTMTPAPLAKREVSVPGEDWAALGEGSLINGHLLRNRDGVREPTPQAEALPAPRPIRRRKGGSERCLCAGNAGKVHDPPCRMHGRPCGMPPPPGGMQGRGGRIGVIGTPLFSPPPRPPSPADLDRTRTL